LQNPAWDSVFEITDDRSVSLPAPMRIVPRYVVDDPNDPLAKPYDVFADIELANNDFSTLPTGGNQAQRHRNVFSIVYSPDGNLLVNRKILIQDIDADDPPDNRGDRTGFEVGPGDLSATIDPDPTATTDEYYTRDDTQKKKLPIGVAIPFLVRDNSTDDTALNFSSVDGLLVYDDSLFNEITDPAQKRDFLLRTAQPLYVSRMTGNVIRGPIGEN